MTAEEAKLLLTNPRFYELKNGLIINLNLIYKMDSGGDNGWLVYYFNEYKSEFSCFKLNVCYEDYESIKKELNVIRRK
ncbi:MAG: hypothetical protein J6D03_00680 [Clostridia bacterium]|nr:hypothetical protein [Clostridia bacterium]